MRIAVLDIGGTSIKSGIYKDGALEDIREQDTQAGLGGWHVMNKAVEILHTYSGYDRIGISTAGQIDSEKGIVRYANSNIPEYTGMKIKEVLEKEFKVPVTVENDVNAAAMGEAVYGAGKDCGDFLCLTYGTGVGGAIIIDNKIYRGSGFSAGEFGAVILHADERCAGDVFSGCYERYASTTALVKKAGQIDISLRSGREVFAAADRVEVRTVIDEWIKEIVYGLATLIHIFNPSCVVLGGGVMKQEYVTKEIGSRLLPELMESCRHVEIRPAKLGNAAGLTGAGYLASLK